MANYLKRLTIPKAYEAVHRALEEEILSGRIPMGSPLPTETELAEQFGVTRHTVRECAPWNRAALSGEKRDGACTPFCLITKTWRRADRAPC